MRSKIDLYRRLARLTSEAAVNDFAGELADRFGPPPPVAAHLLELARLRIWAYGWGVREVRLEDRYAVLGYTSREKLARLADRSAGRLRVADATSAYLPLAQGVADSGAVFAEVKALLRPDGLPS
jgi:transcription-repair coupling factor (superfamily II helicase)